MQDRKLDDWIEGYLQYTDNTEPPYMYRTWVAISVIAAALRRKCYLEWGIFETFPNMFIALVGSSGVGKTQAMRPGRALLREIGIKLAAESITREALIRELRKAGQDPEQIDIAEGIHLHSSLTVHSTELAVFLGYQNRQMIADLCDLYDCDERWEYRTKDEARADIITNVYLNILGAITPTLLQSNLPTEAIGGGLTSRMIAVFEEKKGKVVPTPFLTSKERDIRIKLLDDLAVISQMSGQYTTTEEFIDDWIDWYVKQENNPPFKSQQFEGYFTRRPLHILKLCMILCASEGADMIITNIHLKRAVKLLERTEVNMPKTFAGVGESPISAIVNNVMAYIGKFEKTTIKELHKTFYNDADRKTMESIIRQLQDMDFCTVNYSDGTITYKKE